MENILSHAKEYFVYTRNRFPYLFKPKFLKAAGIFLLLLIILASANSSVPDNWLYPLRVNFLEPIWSFFYLSKYSQAERVRALSGSRLSEAEQLLAKSQLSKDKGTLLRDLFQENAYKQNQAIDSAVNNNDLLGAVVIANRYEADLRGHEEVFLKLRKDLDTAPEQLDSLGVKLNEELLKIAKTRGDIEALFVKNENDMPLQTQSNKTLEETQDLISKTQLKLASINKLLSADEFDSLSADLGSAKNFTGAAKESLQSKKYGTALVLANRAYRYARASEIFIDFAISTR